MKRKRKQPVQWISLDDRINKLQEDLDRLKQFKKYEEYFRHTNKKTRCSYYVELRKMIYCELLAAGLTVVESASILHVSHSTLINLENMKSYPYVVEEVKQFGKIWIDYQRYPYTKCGASSFKPLEREWGIRTPYNLCSIYKHHSIKYK